MRAFLSAAVAAAVLACAALGARAQEITYESLAEQASMATGNLAAALPEPPETPEQAARARALEKAEKALEKAGANPSPLAWVKAFGKVDRFVRGAYPEDEAVEIWLYAFADQHLTLLGTAFNELSDSAALLPDGPAKDALLGLLATLGQEIDDVPWDGSPESFDSLYRDMAGFAARLAAARKKFLRLVYAASGKRGISALGGENRFEAPEATGNLALHPATSRPLSVVLDGTDPDMDFEGNVREGAALVLIVEDAEELVPGIYAVGEGVSGFYGEGLGRMQDRYDFIAGTVTILHLDPATGEIAGTFSLTGAIGETEIAVTEGRFRVRGLETSVAE